MPVGGPKRTSGMSAEVSLTRVENVDADRLAAHGVKLRSSVQRHFDFLQLYRSITLRDLFAR